MDQLLEYLVPIIVFIVWAAGQFLSKRSQEGQEDDTSDESNEERARRIQEEIRRKIAERRQQQEGQQPAPPPLQQQKPSPYRTTPIDGEDSERESAFPPPINTSTEPAFFEAPRPTRNLQAELEEQQKRLEESQRRAEAARLQARNRMAKVAGQTGYSRPKRTVTNLREDIIETLTDPQAARKAVLYYEILGTPVGLREDGKIKPAWAG